MIVRPWTRIWRSAREERQMSFFEELKRRNVFRVGIAYAVSAWVLLQVVDLVLENISAPDWVMQVFMLALAIGFPLALFFAWAFELTPEAGQRLTRNTAIALAIAVVLLLVDRLTMEPQPEPQVSGDTTEQSSAD